MNMRIYIPDPFDGFHPGMSVVYVPPHAKITLDPNHCDYGVVSSITDKWVFVRFYVKGNIRGINLVGATSQACRPEDLMTKEDYERQCNRLNKRNAILG